MATLRFTVRRVFYGIVLLHFVVALNFILIHLAPGDPAEVIAGEMGGITAEILADIRAQYGLDQPVLVQLWDYYRTVVSSDLGMSYYYNLPVAELIAERAGPTVLLVMSSLVLAITVGVFMGVIAARNPYGVASSIVTSIATVGYALPVFWSGIMLIILFGSIWPIFPVAGMSSSRTTPEGIAGALDVLHHLVLPATTLAIIFMAQYARLARASMIDVLGLDYVRTARAKGLSERRVLWIHALRNALLPIITVAGLQFGNLVSGALLVETVFNWPGIGRLAFDSILRRDYPTLMGILLVGAMMVVIANIIADLLYRYADPRIRVEEGR